MEVMFAFLSLWLTVWYKVVSSSVLCSLFSVFYSQLLSVRDTGKRSRLKEFLNQLVLVSLERDVYFACLHFLLSVERWLAKLLIISMFF